MDSKNLIIGSIAILFVVLMALLIFSKDKISNSSSIDLSSVEVLIHHDKTDTEEGYYSVCNLSTENLVKVRNEFQKIYDVKIEDQVTGKSINGDYKVTVDDEYVAFDKENDGILYISTLDSLFKVDSNIYNIVINNCE